MTILVPTLTEKAKNRVDAVMKECVKTNKPVIFSSFYHSLNYEGLITNRQALVNYLFANYPRDLVDMDFDERAWKFIQETIHLGPIEYNKLKEEFLASKAHPHSSGI